MAQTSFSFFLSLLGFVEIMTMSLEDGRAAEGTDGQMAPHFPSPPRPSIYLALTKVSRCKTGEGLNLLHADFSLVYESSRLEMRISGIPDFRGAEAQGALFPHTRSH